MIGLYHRRAFVNVLAIVLATASTLIGLGFLASILWITLARGLVAFGMPLITRITADGAQGGLANAIVGSPTRARTRKAFRWAASTSIT